MNRLTAAAISALDLTLAADPDRLGVDAAAPVNAVLAEAGAPLVEPWWARSRKDGTRVLMGFRESTRGR